MQVDPINPTLTAPGIDCLKLKYDEVLSSFAFNFNLRHHNKATAASGDGGAGITDTEAVAIQMTTGAAIAAVTAAVQAEADALCTDTLKVGRCRLTGSKPGLKARRVSTLETKM